MQAHVVQASPPPPVPPPPPLLLYAVLPLHYHVPGSTAGETFYEGVLTVPSNLFAFLNQTLPSVTVYVSDERQRDSRGRPLGEPGAARVEEWWFRLSELWKWYDQPYGVRIPVSEVQWSLSLFYEPFLSAVHVVPRGDPSGTFHWCERDPPQSRRPVVEVIDLLSEQCPLLMRGVSTDLDVTQSWYCISWYPIIVSAHLKDHARGCFLTYHRFIVRGPGNNNRYAKHSSASVINSLPDSYMVPGTYFSASLPGPVAAQLVDDAVDDNDGAARDATRLPTPPELRAATAAGNLVAGEASTSSSGAPSVSVEHALSHSAHMAMLMGQDADAVAAEVASSVSAAAVSVAAVPGSLSTVASPRLLSPPGVAALPRRWFRSTLGVAAFLPHKLRSEVWFPAIPTPNGQVNAGAQRSYFVPLFWILQSLRLVQQSNAPHHDFDFYASHMLDTLHVIDQDLTGPDGPTLPMVALPVLQMVVYAPMRVGSNPSHNGIHHQQQQQQHQQQQQQQQQHQQQQQQLRRRHSAPRVGSTSAAGKSGLAQLHQRADDVDGEELPRALAAGASGQPEASSASSPTIGAQSSARTGYPAANDLAAQQRRKVSSASAPTT